MAGPQRTWLRSRAITLGINMRSGQQIDLFGKHVQEKLDSLKHYLPDDLVIVPTSASPLQVKEQIDLFMDALYEAIILVVIVSLIGFWEWRSAVLMAISIPITLAMTFGIIYMLGIDIQQVSVPSLIIALGLLVDDPVVAGDSIKRMLAEGQPRIIAPWLGPTKIATAIMYATVTNIVAYLPFLMITGTTGEFIYSLPVVMTGSLMASRLASMTFIPLLGYYLLRPGKKPEPPIERAAAPRASPASMLGPAKFSIEHRWKVAIGSLAFLVLGAFLFSQLKTSFFPDDVQYWSYIDVWLPNDANFDATNQAAQQVERIIREQADAVRQKHPEKDGSPAQILKYVTTWVGGGSPRFWFSASPQPSSSTTRRCWCSYRQRPHARTSSTRCSRSLSEIARRALRLPPAANQSHQLSGRDSRVEPGRREHVAERADNPSCRPRWPGRRHISRDSDRRTARNEWGRPNAPDRLTSIPIAPTWRASPTRRGELGYHRDQRHDRDHTCRMATRTFLWLPVCDWTSAHSSPTFRTCTFTLVAGQTKIPLVQISDIQEHMMNDRIIRIDHFREMSLRLPVRRPSGSEVLKVALPKLKEFGRIDATGLQNADRRRVQQAAGRLPQSGGGPADLDRCHLSGVALPVQQCGQAAAGVRGRTLRRGGRILGLWVMHTSFGFMAFLGIASLIGVIVSHSIVLFDFIEEMHAKGEPFEEAVIDAGIIRLRPGADHCQRHCAGALPARYAWRPAVAAALLRADRRSAVATFITLLMVPVLYSIFVLDLKILTWETKPSQGAPAGS